MQLTTEALRNILLIKEEKAGLQVSSMSSFYANLNLIINKMLKGIRRELFEKKNIFKIKTISVTSMFIIFLYFLTPPQCTLWLQR